MGLTLFDLHPRKCRQCGKKFESTMDYAYKITTGKTNSYYWFCSWSCIQAYRKEKKK